MTTYMQSEYEAMQDLEDKPTLTEVRTCNNMTNNPDMLTDRELEEVTAVFKSFETGLREATIHPKDLHKAMQRLGLNPTEQEVVDIPNEIARKGLIYFPDFCQLVLGRYWRTAPGTTLKFEIFGVICSSWADSAMTGSRTISSDKTCSRCFVAPSLTRRTSRRRSTSWRSTHSPRRTLSTS